MSFDLQETLDALGRTPAVLDRLLQNLSPMLQMIVRENIDLRFDLHALGACVKVDPNQLEQVVVNLVVNASDAMPSGGTLTVRTNRAADEDPSSGWVRLTVEDTGVGMNEPTRARVFGWMRRVGIPVERRK